MENRPNHRTLQNIGYLAGFIVSVVVIIFLLLPGQENLHSLGPANVGHETLACEACHKSNILWYNRVTNTVCLECHDRPYDNHPVDQYEGVARFDELLQTLKPDRCVSCHLEHQGKRVTNIPPTFCANCHKDDLEFDNDPISSHKELADSGNWGTCLGCHDFHGNHNMDTETAISKAINPELIVSYFNGGASPYPAGKYVIALPGGGTKLIATPKPPPSSGAGQAMIAGCEGLDFDNPSSFGGTFDPVGDAIAGKKLFLDECSLCHGRKAQGKKRTEPMRQSEKVQSMSNKYIYCIIFNGIPDTRMESYTDILVNSQVDDIIAFIRSIQ